MADFEIYNYFYYQNLKSMIRNLAYLVFVAIIISLSSCRNDFDFQPSTGGLEFSRDTIYLDTVFTNIGSSTYTLKVFNNSSNNISIPNLALAKGLNSKYRMTVDGMQGNEGKIFNNVELLAKDSMYIFIETTADIADANPTDFLYTDQIQFGAGTNLQTVELVTLIQDAVFLYPQRNGSVTESIPFGEDEIYGFFLDENDAVNGNEYNWTNNKPYVIYGYAGVDSGKTLTIDPGAKVHFHESSGILVANGASIKANGTLSNQIIFEGDRLEPGFADTPGQWGAIWMTPGSTGNEFNYVTVKNSIIGLWIQDSDATINNTQIYNSSNFGIYGQTATITGENVVVNSAGQVAVACTLGGSYTFKHSTFNNDWPSSKQVALLIDNYYVNDNQEIAYDLAKAEFDNCIIYGSNQVEFLVNRASAGNIFNYQLNNCLLKFNNVGNQFTNNPDYQFNDGVHYNNITQNQNPQFYKASKNKLNIKETSAAIGLGSTNYFVPLDILGVSRTSPPDLGAYQNAAQPE